MRTPLELLRTYPRAICAAPSMIVVWLLLQYVVDPLWWELFETHTHIEEIVECRGEGAVQYDCEEVVGRAPDSFWWGLTISGYNLASLAVAAMAGTAAA